MAWIELAITRLPEGDAMASAKAWREHLRNRMSSREGMVARVRSQELGEAVLRELAAATTGSASRAARAAVRSGLDELGLTADTLQRLGLASLGSVSGSAEVGTPGSKPAIVVQPLPSSTLAPTTRVEAALQGWLRAWSSRRVDDYLRFYDPRFAPLGGGERSAWVSQRRAAIRRPSWLKVEAEQVSTTEMSADEVVVGFVQKYSASTGHRESTRKTMIWRWSDGRWQIVSEQSSPLVSDVLTKVSRVESVGPAAIVPSPGPDPAGDPLFEPTVRAWLKSWADRQSEAFLDFYAPGFKVPGGLERQAWAADRIESMKRPAWIKVRADQLKTFVHGETAEARFVQVYVTAPGVVEVVRKTMRWARSEGRWQIIEEDFEPIPRKRPGR
jgi:hypothetical protein